MDSKNIFTHQEKKQIALRIEQLRNKKHYKQVFKIVHDDKNKFTSNDNGVYININSLNDKTLQKIKEYLDNIETSKNIIPVPDEYVPYCSETTSDVRYSTHERSLLNKIHNKKSNLWNLNESEILSSDMQTNDPSGSTDKKPVIEIKPFCLFMND